MSIVTFWNDERDQTGKTLTSISVATRMAIERNYRILLISTSFQDNTMKNCFWGDEVQKTLKLFGVKNNNIAVENGVVSVTNGVIGGKYKVQATIADTEISATADFEVVAKSKGTLKAIYTTGDETTGVVETVDVYTEDDNKFEADEVSVPESYH